MEGRGIGKHSRLYVQQSIAIVLGIVIVSGCVTTLPVPSSPASAPTDPPIASPSALTCRRYPSCPRPKAPVPRLAGRT